MILQRLGFGDEGFPKLGVGFPRRSTEKILGGG